MVEISLHKPLNRPVDPSNLSRLEKEHVPVVLGNRWQVKGDRWYGTFMLAIWVNHEMTEEHHINAIAVGDGEKDLVRAYLTPNHSIPRIHLTVKLTESKTLKIHVCCNKHGCWETEFPVQVVSLQRRELLMKEATEVIPERFCRYYT